MKKKVTTKKYREPLDLLDVEEAASYLGISARSVRRHSSADYRGAKPLKRSMVGGLVRFDPADLDAFVVR